jgi:cytidine deaminase
MKSSRQVSRVPTEPKVDPAIGLTLINAARSAAAFSYSPYSKFAVGAAVLTDDGTIITGCNVENASYGLTICAERVAIFKAISQGKTRIRALAVTNTSGSPSPPCGACRQVIHEFADASTRVFYEDRDGSLLGMPVSDLLPDAFGPDNLKRST